MASMEAESGEDSSGLYGMEYLRGGVMNQVGLTGNCQVFLGS